MHNKIVPARAAAGVINYCQTVITLGFVGIAAPALLLATLEERFLETAKPCNLTLVFAAGQSDGKTRDLNRLGYRGLL